MTRHIPKGILDFMELSKELVFIFNHDFRIIEVNQACVNISGYEKHELTGNKLKDFTSPKFKTADFPSLNNTNSVHEFEFEFIQKNGTLINLQWSIKSHSEENLYLGIAKRIASPDTREREKNLESSQALINGTQNLIWRIDKNYQLQDVNDAMKKQFQEKFNFKLEIGQNMIDFPAANQEYTDRWKLLYDKCLQGETISIDIAPSENKKLDSPWIHANLTPIHKNSEVVGLVCHSTDITEKKTFEIELQKQNKFIQSILEHIPMGVAAHKINDGKQVLMNQKFSQVYGWPKSDLTDVKTFFRKVYPNPEYRNEIKKKVTADLKSGDIDKMQWNEIKITTKKGDSKYIDAKNIPLFEQDLMISTVLDVSQKVKNKQGLEKALDEKKNILESISDAFYAIDQDYNFTFVNQSALKAMRKSQTEIIGKNLFKEFPQLSKTIFKDHLTKVKESGKPSRFEFYYKYYDLWFDESIYPSSDGFSIYFKDITKRKIISQALEEAYEKESEILESISDAFVAVDEKYNFTYINKKAEEVLKIKKEKAIGKNMWDLFEYAKGTIAEYEYDKALQNNETRVFDFYNEHLNTWFNIKSFPSKYGLSIYFRNISQEKEQQKELEKLNEELQDYTQKLELSNKELEQFAYIASHDLQEPLRMVSSFMTQLQKKYEGQLDDKAQTYINFAVDGAKRMRQIIIDLLEFSKAGRQKEDLQKLDLNDEIAEVLSLFHTNLDSQKINLEIKDLPEIIYTKTGISQLFRNLIGNAIKYSKKEGKAQIEVNWKENKKEFTFEVKDNGIGIDEKYQEKIFQIFQRLYSKSEYSGTGLGLAICKKVVEKYGGRIWVKSQLGKGSSFYFTVPKNITI